MLSFTTWKEVGIRVMSINQHATLSLCHSTLQSIFAEERDLTLDLATSWKNLTAPLPANSQLAGNPYAAQQAALGNADYVLAAGQNGQPGQAQKEYDTQVASATATRDRNITLINADLVQKGLLVTETSRSARETLDQALATSLSAAQEIHAAEAGGNSGMPLPDVVWTPLIVNVRELGVQPLADDILTANTGHSAEITGFLERLRTSPQGEIRLIEWSFTAAGSRPQDSRDPWGVAGRWFDTAYQARNNFVDALANPGQAGSALYAGLQFRYYALTDPSQGDWFTRLTNASAGFGDAITFGLTARVRQFGGFDAVDYNSGAYQVGGEAGIAFNIATAALNPAAARWGIRTTPSTQLTEALNR
ncbi:MAG: hypothetical protein SFX18_10365 [Pirellulales bacterium]|nr:hypothetical protein [Pirellulales bacterium]